MYVHYIVPEPERMLGILARLTTGAYGRSCYPKGPCTQIVYTLGPMYLYREYFKANVYTISVHGPLGLRQDQELRWCLGFGEKSSAACCLFCFLGFRV